ncbi:putative Pentafunctional AROM polypeptide [Glarea lozoyensis 74030]|uniref:Putative Pentafunctional AROM polypeptide n=1 Tax=Glarea lozoyensis (strain ATCC 74030 / MF5533) TaxID=1104152 RepID=H0EUB8_GLAL7|nr:putative Pentafunctional AROM polypeptide [Glarea lozoyensis 74030]
MGDNAMWKGIRATLTRDFAPSAYKGRAAIILSASGEDAASAIFALKSLNVGKIYTVGFKARGPLAADVEPFTSIESVQRVNHPFAIISCLPPMKSHLVQPLLRHFSTNGRATPGGTLRNGGSPFQKQLEANGPRSTDPLAVAEKNGWTSYGVADASAFTTVETLRLLVGQNVPSESMEIYSLVLRIRL